MKRETLKTVFLAGVLAFTAAAGGAGCLYSGFALPLKNPEKLLMFLAAVSFLCAFCFRFRPAALGLLCISMLTLGYVLRRTDGAIQCVRILSVCIDVWGYDTIGWKIPEGNPAADFPLALLGSLTAAAAAGTVYTRRSLPALLLTALPLGLCLISPDTVPNLPSLFSVLLVLSLLLLTGSLRHDSKTQANHLLATGALPLSLMLGLILLFAPRSSYVNHTPRIREQLAILAEKALSRMEGLELPAQIAGFLPSEVNLADRNGGHQPSTPMLEITSDQSGVLYLRGRDYDRYTGEGWSVTDGRTEEFGGTGQPLATVTIRTLSDFRMLLLPYYPREDTLLREGMAENTENTREYTLSLYAPAPGQAPGEEYLRLPAETSIRAGALLDSIPGSFANTAAAVKTIGDYVRGSAEYDLATAAMPETETDFAMWFLEKSDRGYCVHFATAAAVLLRSVGIPARYVTGYKTEVEAGRTVTVTTDDAHAWAEYFDAGAGIWRILEATPAAQTGIPDFSAPTEAEATEAEPEEASVPSAEADSQTQHGITAAGNPRVILLMLFGMILIPLRSRGAVLLRYFRQRRGIANSRALELWQECCLLAKALSEEPPEPLRELAEKARFSREGITEQELSHFRAYCQKARARIEQLPRLRRFCRKWIQGIV